MKKCFSFTKNRKLVVVVVRGAFFIVEEVLSYCRSTGRIGPTSQRLQNRIKQRIPKAIRKQTQPDRDLFQSNSTSTSAIGQHLLNNKKCASYYDDN